MSRIRKTAGSVAFATERLIYVAAAGMIVLFGAVAIAGIGPSIEARFWPVIGTQAVTSVEREGNLVHFSMTIEKLRDCRLAGGDWSLDDGGHHTAITVTNAIGLPAGSVTYPVGQLAIGPFTASLPFDDTGEARLYATLYYDCHVGWLTKVVLGPVPVPEAT